MKSKVRFFYRYNSQHWGKGGGQSSPVAPSHRKIGQKNGRKLEKIGPTLKKREKWEGKGKNWEKRKKKIKNVISPCPCWQLRLSCWIMQHAALYQTSLPYNVPYYYFFIGFPIRFRTVQCYKSLIYIYLVNDPNTLPNKVVQTAKIHISDIRLCNHHCKLHLNQNCFWNYWSRCCSNLWVMM